LFVSDDLYMLHEQSSRMNLNDRTVYAVYAALALAFVVTNRSHLLQTPFILFFAAVVFFAVSIVVDSFTGLGRRLPSGLENMLELIGICFWSAYLIKCCRNALRLGAVRVDHTVGAKMNSST
jgi:C4-dicarboxylate transporter